MRRLAQPPPRAGMGLAAQVRVIYGDTDRMGIVYHGTYLRFMEHARVEFMRTHGVVYAAMERAGFGLPVTDLALSYLQPARYDDIVSVWVRLARVGYARIFFDYELSVEPGDRHELDERVVLLHARTQHGCTRLEDGRATRMPEDIYARLQDITSEDEVTDSSD